MRQLLGVIIIAAGLALVLRNAGIVDINIWGTLIRLWPLLLIYWGIAGLRSSMRAPTSILVALINGFVTAFGLLLLAGNFGLLAVSIGRVVSYGIGIMLLLVGGSLLLNKPVGSGHTHWALLGGVDLGQTPFHLADSNFISLMGGGKLNLTQATISEPVVNLTCLAIMGGWEIIVPAGLRVEVEAGSVMGGVELFGDGTGGIVSTKIFAAPEGEGPLVRIRAQSLMGGIEIKRSTG